MRGSFLLKNKTTIRTVQAGNRKCLRQWRLVRSRRPAAFPGSRHFLWGSRRACRDLWSFFFTSCPAATHGKRNVRREKGANPTSREAREGLTVKCPKYSSRCPTAPPCGRRRYSAEGEDRSGKQIKKHSV